MAIHLVEIVVNGSNQHFLCMNYYSFGVDNQLLRNTNAHIILLELKLWNWFLMFRNGENPSYCFTKVFFSHVVFLYFIPFLLDGTKLHNIVHWK